MSKPEKRYCYEVQRISSKDLRKSEFIRRDERDSLFFRCWIDARCFFPSCGLLKRAVTYRFHHDSREIGDHVIILAKYGVALGLSGPFSTIGRR
jgi:hypothetical protein